MMIDNIEIIYFLDYIERRIHLLEVNKSKSILNEISPDFQKRIIEQEHLLMDVIDFEWILYASGGLIFAFKDYNLHFIEKTDKRLHSPFKAQIEGD